MSKSLDENALLACPFCGGEAYTGEGDGKWFAGCRDCYAMVGEGYDRDAWPAHMFATEAEAIAAWNRRDDAAARERDRLREALQKIADAPAWGAPERFDVTPTEVRILARAALEARHDAR